MNIQFYGARVVVILSKELCDGCFEAFLEYLGDYFGEEIHL